MNAIAPAHSFDLTAERYDTYVGKAFASTKAARHMRDRLIAQMHGGQVDHLLLRSKRGFEAVSDEANRAAALNVIDFTFEPLVLPSMSVAQATGYLRAVENSLQISEASGLDGPGPLLVDTVHHVCIFSVLFQLAAFLGHNLGFDRVVLLHQGQRPEPRLGIVSDLLRKAHGIALVLVQLQGRWFQKLAQLTTPNTAIFYLTDMPPEALQRAAPTPRGLSRLDLYAAPNVSVGIDTVSGSSTLAKRLGASHAVLDYPARDRVRIRRFDLGKAGTLCPVEDWVFWPLLGRHPESDGQPSRN